MNRRITAPVPLRSDYWPHPAQRLFADAAAHGKLRSPDRRHDPKEPLLMSVFSSPAASSRTLTPGALLRGGAGIIGGSLLIAIAAHVAVPFWPVPITLQTLAVLGLGAVLGPVVAVGAVLAWIAEGLVGLPVFANAVGPAALLGPTGGYIIGFVPAAAIAGLAARRGWLRAPLSAAIAFLVADVALFALGVGRLAGLIGWDKAIAGGLTPFLVGEALKLSLLTVAALALSGPAKRRR
jgi:biotin transport system substrate-specific component